MVTKADIQFYYEIIREGLIPPDSHKRMIRTALKSRNDPLQKPLLKEWRCYYPENDYESMYEYGIVPLDDDATEEDIEEIVRDLERHNTTPYDCSGRLCTSWISWKRTPVGLAIVHRLTLDV